MSAIPDVSFTAAAYFDGIVRCFPKPYYLRRTSIPGEDIIYHTEGIDLLSANIEFAGLEVTLVNTMSRETILREFLNSICDRYDVILLDCCSSRGMLTINAPATADEVIIPA